MAFGFGIPWLHLLFFRIKEFNEEKNRFPLYNNQRAKKSVMILLIPLNCASSDSQNARKYNRVTNLISCYKIEQNITLFIECWNILNRILIMFTGVRHG